jgi:hypothetical protein
MENQFIPWEIARTLKEKGFREPCLAVYEILVMGELKPKFRSNYNGEGLWLNHNTIKKTYKDNDWYWSAPLYQQAITWLLEEHEIFISEMFDDNQWTCDIFTFAQPDLCHNTTIEIEEKSSYVKSLKSRNEVLAKAIEEALKLIR